MSTQPIDWKNPIDVSQWRATRKKRIEQIWGDQFKPLLIGIPLAATRRAPDLAAAIDQVQLETESVLEHARRLGTETAGSHNLKSPRSYSVPDLIGKDRDGEFVIAPAARRADPTKIEKGKVMFRNDLVHKAQREIACGLLGGDVHCRNGHTFRAGYECGNRYCKTCGPKGANKVFAKYVARMRLAAAKILDCGLPNCKHCDPWRNNPGKTKLGEIPIAIPHWPPPMKGKRPARVIAQLDFMIPTLAGRPEAWQVKQFNGWIKKFARAIERSLGISRCEYGILFCDELGGNNTNIHAHAIFVGPFLPQTKRQMSDLWARVTGISAGAFLTIRLAETLEQALYHAIKYPAKYAEKAAPQRLAELEIIFHRVRRVHALASFYNAPDPDDPKDPGIARKCPACGEQLSEPRWWFLIDDLAASGLRDVVEIRREMGKNKVLLGVGNSSP